MKLIDIQDYLWKLKVFSIEDLKMIDDKYEKSKISNWKKNWYIKQIIRWYYLFSDININEKLLFMISNKIYFPSYISLESAFSFYWLIPEKTFVITWISTKKTNYFTTDFWTFDYKKIKSTLFWWYNIEKIKDNKILIASLEKAILDYFYLYDNISTLEDIKYLRWNKDILQEKLDINILKKCGTALHSKVINYRIDLLIKYISNDWYGKN